MSQMHNIHLFSNYYYNYTTGDEDSEEEEEEEDEEDAEERGEEEGDEDPQNPTLKNLYAGKFVSFETALVTESSFYSCYVS
jgi:hypothetical protein